MSGKNLKGREKVRRTEDMIADLVDRLDHRDMELLDASGEHFDLLYYQLLATATNKEVAMPDGTAVAPEAATMPQRLKAAEQVNKMRSAMKPSKRRVDRAQAKGLAELLAAKMTREGRTKPVTPPAGATVDDWDDDMVIQ